MGQPDADCPPDVVPDGIPSRKLSIVNRKGLHARASAKFVQTVERYTADVVKSFSDQQTPVDVVQIGNEVELEYADSFMWSVLFAL